MPTPLEQIKIGQKIRFSYALPALSCCMNGRNRTGSGKVVKKEKDEWLVVEEWKDKFTRIRLCEVVSLKEESK